MTWWEKALLAYLAASLVGIGWLLRQAHNAPERNDW